ncbi:MAG: nicotinate-nucleotide adenylyltransferase, partial [Chthoniobacterales bacterium]
MKKIGIYGGSFDPVHHGHLILAREALESLALEEMIFVLAAQSPHKQNQAPTGSEVRWEMLEAAIADEPGFSASRLEIDRPPPSYSVETAETLHAAQPAAEFYFLVGEDNLPELKTWHRFDDLQKLVHFIVLDRSGEEVEYTYRAIRQKIDISATTIRKRVASGQSIRYLVPEAVE